MVKNQQYRTSILGGKCVRTWTSLAKVQHLYWKRQNYLLRATFVTDAFVNDKNNKIKVINIRKEKPKATYDLEKNIYINPPQSPRITINAFIYVSNTLTEAAFYYSIVKSLANAINNFFSKYHNYHYKNYNFYLNHTFIYDPDDVSFCKTNRSKIFQLQKKINPKLIANLHYFEKNLQTYFTKNNSTEIQALYVEFAKEIAPLMKYPLSNLSLIPVPNKESNFFYESLITDACKEITSCVKKPSKITINTDPIIIKLTTMTPTTLLKCKPVLEIDNLYNIQVLINITQEQFLQLLVKKSK